MNVTQISTLLIDLDGTLLGNRSVPLSLDFVRRALGVLKARTSTIQAVKTLYEILQEFKRKGQTRTNDQRVIEIFSKRLGIQDLEAARQMMRESVLKLFPELKRHFFPISDAQEFLKWASPRYRLILASNPVWPPEIQELRVSWAGIDPAIFQSITHVRRMSSCKPHVSYFKEIIKQENLNPKQCLHIGDELKMDLPATRAGIPVFIVGSHKRLTRLKPLKGSTAPAWGGTYQDLKQLLLTEGNDL